MSNNKPQVTTYIIFVFFVFCLWKYDFTAHFIVSFYFALQQVIYGYVNVVVLEADQHYDNSL